MNNSILSKTPLALSLIALLCPLLILSLVLGGTKMQFADYFYMISDMFNKNGEFLWRGLFNTANEHTIIIPKILYLINIVLFGGSNITLGIFVWLISCGTLLIVFKFIVDYKLFNHNSLATILVLLSIYIFPSKAMHNFMLAMSGSAWILANFFSILALLFTVNRNFILTLLFGSFATLTYGTGLAVWPAIGIVMLLNRTINIRNILTLSPALLVIMLSLSLYQKPAHHPPIEFSVLKLFETIATLAGSLHSYNSTHALVIGLGLISSFIYLAVINHSDNKLKSFFVGIGMFSLFAFFMIALSRSGMNPMQSRYMALISLFPLSVSLLAIIKFADKKIILMPLLLFALWPLFTSASVVTEHIAKAKQRDALSVAAVLNHPDNLMRAYSTTTNYIFKSIHHYPFDGSYHLDCGYIGKKIENFQLNHHSLFKAKLEGTMKSPNPSISLVEGWLVSKQKVECMLILNSDNKVIGAAVHGLERYYDNQSYKKSQYVGFAGVALNQPNLKVLAKFKGNNLFYLIQ